MISVEQLIANQQKEIEKLQKEVQELEQSVKDFESLAHTWKDSYEDLELKYKRDLGNAQRNIDQLLKDLDDQY